MSDKNYHSWKLRARTLKRSGIPLVMGILNVTPDSFSDGGMHTDLAMAIDHAQKLEADGADILDIGGESTRPGALPVSEVEEYRRIIPLVEALRGKVQIPISIDTTKSGIARACLERGVEIINDISGLMFDPEMPSVCAEFECGLVCMHIQGTPQTMQQAPVYKNCVQEVKAWLADRMQRLTSMGIQPERILLDPGIGFGKTAEHNVELLSSIRTFQELGQPILIGHSRKRFLGKILDDRSLDERLMGTVGVSLAVAAQGVDMIRVHDVRQNLDALIAYQAVIESVKREEF